MGAVGGSTLLLSVVFAAGTPTSEPRLLISPLCADAPHLREIADGLAAKLRPAGWNVRKEQMRQICTPTQTPTLRSTKQAIARGVELFHAMDFTQASAELRRGSSHVTDPALLDRASDSLREALVFLAWIELDSGERARAGDRLERLRTLWPQWTPDPMVFPPHVVEALASAQIPPSGQLRVMSTPPGARVHLNGEELCLTPCEAIEVPAGFHALRLELDDHVTHVEPLRMGSGQQRTVNQPLAQSKAMLWSRTTRARDHDALLGVLGITGADAAVLLDEHNGLRTAAIISPGRVDFVELSGERPKIDRDNIVGALGPPPAHHQDSAGGGQSMTKRWWFWPAVAAVGVGLLGGGVGYYAWRSSDKMTVVVAP